METVKQNSKCLPNSVTLSKKFSYDFGILAGRKGTCVVNVVSIFTGSQKRIYSHVGFSLEKLSLFVFFLLLRDGLWILENLVSFWHFLSLWLSSQFKQIENIDFFCYVEGVQKLTKVKESIVLMFSSGQVGQKKGGQPESPHHVDARHPSPPCLFFIGG